MTINFRPGDSMWAENNAQGEHKDAPEKPAEKDQPHGNQPPKPKETDQATNDNDLTTGHSRPGDGGDDNAKEKKGA